MGKKYGIQNTPVQSICTFLLLICASLASVGQLHAQEVEKILITDVFLFGRDGKQEDQQVNILISDSILELVSKDEIFLGEGMIGYHGQQGYVFGVLGIGSRASFLILDQNPKEKLEVLLDTKSHVIFAIQNGEIVLNSLDLISVPEADADTVQLKSPALAKKPRLPYYIPPPMALPLNYQDDTKWNRWDTKPFSGIFVAAAAIDRQQWLFQDSNSEEQVGDLNDFNGGEIRAFRFGIAGTLNFKRPWVYTLLAATHVFDKGYNSKETSHPTLLDYRLDIPLFKGMVMSIGKQKEAISMERLLIGTQLSMSERPAVIDAHFPFRNVGVTFSGRQFNERVTWALGVYNDWFDASQKFKESSNQIIGRLTGLVYVSDQERQLLHVGLGIRYDDAKEDLYFQSSPEFNLSSLFVETGPFEADRSLTYDLEISWRGGPFWLSTEIIRNQNKSPDLENPVFGGFHVSGTWVLTREMRKYNKRNGTMGGVPVSRSVYQGGPGAWELASRFSRIDLSNGLVDGGEMDILSMGLNWWLQPTFGISLNYRYIILERNQVKGRSSGLLARIILMLE